MAEPIEAVIARVLWRHRFCQECLYSITAHPSAPACSSFKPDDERTLATALQEALRDRDAARRDVHKLLGMFREKGHPGEPALRTGWQYPRHLDEIRARHPEPTEEEA